MTLWLEDADVTLHHGDVLDVLRQMSNNSVDCCVTSPPYWGLRDYGNEGQLGLESTPEEYVTRMVEVFREIRRVLASHGSVWLNLGDSFNEKQLVGVPWHVAFALQADGWYLRSDIIWAKPNPMPESVTDRPTKAHEYVFLLSKQPRYFFDQEAVREPAAWERWGDQTNPKHEGTNGAAGWIGSRSKDALTARSFKPGWSGNPNVHGEKGHPLPGAWTESGGGRNIRSVWSIPTQPYPEAHFATFPEELARRCIAAGCPEQVCRVCGKARERMTDSTSQNSDERRQQGIAEAAARGIARNRAMKDSLKPPLISTLGFTDCGHSDYRHGLTLDPFIGSGTVAHVARKLGRHAVGIDLNESYLELAAKRLQQQSLFADAGT